MTFKGSWKAVEAWLSKRPEKGIREGTASVAVDIAGLKGSYKEVEAWNHVESQGKTIGEA